MFPTIACMCAISLPTVAGAGAQPVLALEMKGYIQPRRQATVGPRVAGQLVEVLIEEGQRVKAGDVLGRLDPAKYEAVLRLARAELRVAERRLEQQQKALPQPDASKMAVAEAEVEVAAARVALAQLDVDATTIRAPFAGIVIVKKAEKGMHIDPRGHQVSAHLCEIADVRELEAELSINERDFHKIATGLKCAVRLEAFPNTTYPGKIVRIAPVADRAKGAVSFRVRLEVPQGDERPLPEMGAVVSIFTNK